MKALAAMLFFPMGMVGLLRSDMTPWRLVSAQELDELRARATSVSQEVAQTSAQQSQGAWMHEPTYRSALEKTTVIGVPERSKSREAGR